MQVRLVTIIETIIDTEENNPSFEEAKREIFDRFNSGIVEELGEDIQSAHSEAVVFDSIRSQSIEHRFEEVKP